MFSNATRSCLCPEQATCSAAGREEEEEEEGINCPTLTYYHYYHHYYYHFTITQSHAGLNATSGRPRERVHQKLKCDLCRGWLTGDRMDHREKKESQEQKSLARL